MSASSNTTSTGGMAAVGISTLACLALIAVGVSSLAATAQESYKEKTHVAAEVAPAAAEVAPAAAEVAPAAAEVAPAAAEVAPAAAEGAPAAAETPAPAFDMEAGKKAWATSACQGCHQAAIDAMGPSFKSVSLRRANSKPEDLAVLYATVKNGFMGKDNTYKGLAMPKAMMPPNALPDDQIKLLVTYMIEAGK